MVLLFVHSLQPTWLPMHNICLPVHQSPSLRRRTSKEHGARSDRNLWLHGGIAVNARVHSWSRLTARTYWTVHEATCSTTDTTNDCSLHQRTTPDVVHLEENARDTIDIGQRATQPCVRQQLESNRTRCLKSVALGVYHLNMTIARIASTVIRRVQHTRLLSSRGPSGLWECRLCISCSRLCLAGITLVVKRARCWGYVLTSLTH